MNDDDVVAYLTATRRLAYEAGVADAYEAGVADALAAVEGAVRTMPSLDMSLLAGALAGTVKEDRIMHVVASEAVLASLDVLRDAMRKA